MKQRFRLIGTGLVLVVYLLIAVVLMMERGGVRLDPNVRASSQFDYTGFQLASEAMEHQETECLLIVNSEDAASANALVEFRQMMQDMKVGFTVADLAKEPLPELSGYRCAVVLIKNLSWIDEDIVDLTDWVYEGGRAMFALTIEKEVYFDLIASKLGVVESSYFNDQVDAIWFDSSLLLGGGQSYAVSDGYDSAMEVVLGDKVHVLARNGDEKGMPLIWYRDYGKGRFVVDNFDIMNKATRGLYAASYSLLEDAFAYPVLNGQVFYLDDFPSPVPDGDGTFIARDYSMRIADFYSNIWWRDMISMASRHGIRYTGVVIENYDDETTGEIVMQQDTGRFQYFGNMLLHMGGEIGYHGYNHQPFSFTGDTDYGDAMPYNTWPDETAASAAMGELERFVSEQFVTNNAGVYVPPSNIISERGEAMLAKNFPSVHTIAGSYFTEEEEFVRGQEFGRLPTGQIAQPRITSGALGGAFNDMAALSELNMHDVNTHFLHPDDTLDEDRGAALGWGKLYDNLCTYMDWLFDAAPHIRRMTGTELSQVIARYSAVEIQRTVQDNCLTLNVNDAAIGGCFFLRLNRGEPAKVEGAELEKLADGLYLLTAQQKDIQITWE